MAKRVCAEPGCPTLTTSTRCHEHERAKDKARGTRQQRGYDRDHELTRERWAPLVAKGGVPCRRCRTPLDPTEPWDLGHPDTACPRPRAPEHIGCNRAVAGR